MESVSRSQLASRLTINCLDSYVEPQKLKDIYITVMDVSDNMIVTDFMDANYFSLLLGVWWVSIVTYGEGRNLQVLSWCQESTS